MRPRASVLLSLLLLVLLAAACAQDDAGGASTEPGEAADAGTEDEASAEPSPASDEAESEEDAAPEPLDPPVVIEYAGTGINIDAPVWVAQERGYFDELGLDVNYNLVGGGEGATLLTTGQVEFAGVGVNPAFFNAAVRGAPFYLAAGITVLTPESVHTGLVVRQDHMDSGRYEEVGDLAGMTVGITRVNATVGYNLRAALATGGLSLADIEVIEELPYGEQMVALANDRIDAALMGQPFITHASEENVAQLVVGDGEVAEGQPLLVAMDIEFAEENPEAAMRFFHGWLRAQRDIWDAFEGSGAERDLIIDLLVANTSVDDPEVWEAVHESGGLYGFAPDGEFDPEWIQRLHDDFLENNFIEQEVPDIESLINTKPLDAALEILGGHER